MILLLALCLAAVPPPAPPPNWHAGPYPGQWIYSTAKSDIAIVSEVGSGLFWSFDLSYNTPQFIGGYPTLEEAKTRTERWERKNGGGKRALIERGGK